jgi:hypothetical protein
MSNQEMQFADPDWKPSQQPGSKTNPQEQEEYAPQPINTDYGEQNKWKSAPPSPPQQEGYAGLRPYAGPTQGQMQGGNFGQRPYRRRGRGPWFWIILAFIIISLASGGFRSISGPSFNPGRFGSSPIEGKPIDYQVSGQATIVINDPNGNVTVTEGQSNTDVIIQAVNTNNFSGNPNDIQSNISQNANNITANVQDSVDLQVTVPQGAILNLQTESGDISVNGVNGQMTLKTNSGSISASNDFISGTSSLTSNSSDITFDGTLGTGGSYQFQTGSNGSVDLTVSSASAFHVDATTNSGSIDIPGVNAQNNKASGDVGASSQVKGTNVTINSDGGDINLHQN